MSQMQYQGNDGGNEQYEFAAQPQAVMPQGLYRQQNEQGDMYESEEGFNQQQNVYEELNDPVEDETQLIPDYYVDRPPTPEYKPKERGTDVSTQIIDTELFDYELEVLPILQVVVGKVCEQARMELIEDYEKEQLRQHKSEYIKKRNAELMVTQRLENAYLRRKEEKERRTFQHKLRRDQDKLVHKKFIARMLCKRALYTMKKNALDDLEDQGFLKDNLEINIKKDFIPWLLDQTIDLIAQATETKTQVNELVDQYQKEANSEHKKYIEIENLKKKEELRKREEEKLRIQDKKQRKQEWKRKIALQEANKTKFNEIQKKVIKTAAKIENILDVDIVDIFGDGRTNAIGGVFGGVLGQLWIILDVLDKLSITENEKLDQQNIKDFIKKFLQIGVKNFILLSINPQKQEQFEEIFKQMEENYAEFTTNIKPQLIKDILANSQDYMSSRTLQFLTSNLSSESQNSILLPLLEFIFETVFWSVIQEAGSNEKDNSQDKSKIMNTSQDQSFISAKNKLQIQYQQNNLQQLQSIVRIRIPFLNQEDLDKQKEEEEQRRIQEEQNKSKTYSNKDNSKDKSGLNLDNSMNEKQTNQSPQILIEGQENQIKDKYDEFIDVQDGVGYEREKAKNKSFSRRYDIRGDGQIPYAFNISAVGINKLSIYDERIQLFFRAAVFKLLKEQFADKLKSITEEQLLEKCLELDEQLEQKFVSEVLNKQVIYDWDLYE